MANEKPKRIPASDRSMSAVATGPELVFFFPKRNPPVSIRATSRKEAERLLETPSPKENV